MCDKDDENIPFEEKIKHNLLMSFPPWLRSVQKTIIFKDVADSYVKVVKDRTPENIEELKIIYDNFKHFYENDADIQAKKQVFDKEEKLKKREREVKAMYLKSKEPPCK